MVTGKETNVKSGKAKTWPAQPLNMAMSLSVPTDVTVKGNFELPFVKHMQQVVLSYFLFTWVFVLFLSSAECAVNSHIPCHCWWSWWWSGAVGCKTQWDQCLRVCHERDHGKQYNHRNQYNHGSWKDTWVKWQNCSWTQRCVVDHKQCAEFWPLLCIKQHMPTN